MPTVDWLKKEFDYGYSSGRILDIRPDEVRAAEEKRIGGSYYHFFQKAVRPHLRPDAKVLELGPGRGSWSMALLHYLTEGELHTCDFQDVTPWLKPENHPGRLFCHQVTDNTFSAVPDGYFDFFFSFGVLVHCNQTLIAEVLTNARSRMKDGGLALHLYADWDKLEAFGWERGGVPEQFKTMPDDAIWWPRNNRQAMTDLVQAAGWTVLESDLNLFRRDGLILMRK